MDLRLRRKPTSSSRSGVSMIEVSIALLIAATFLLVSASGFSASLSAAGQAERVTDGALFLQTTLESTGAQPYDTLLTLNGNRVFEDENWDDSKFVVDINTFLVEVGLIQITAILTDTRSGREIGRVTSLRSDR